jgi:transposase InsO family protein
MPWARTDRMSERVKFVAAYLEREASFSDLCLDFGISRKTGYKWVRRYEAEGPSALLDRSRAPHSHPNAVSSDIVQAILAIRRRHPRWGPRKVKVVLRRQRPRATLPAASTIGDILKRSGLVRPRRRVRRSSPYGDRLRQYDAPNAVWCADFKGCFSIGGQRGGERCHPLTISDGFSRFLLRCRGLRRPLSQFARRVFESAFCEYGLPRAIRTDNGPPFSTLAPGGLSQLSVWWIRLGIRPERIMPGRPEQNGRHERMHRTLKAETAKPPRSSFGAQQRAFDRFVIEYNEERPHEALGQEVPASLYRPSLRSYPSQLPEPEYPNHFETRVAYPNGVISFGTTQWYVSNCIAGERVGLEPCDDGRWRVHFGWVPIGILDTRRAAERNHRNFGVLVPIVDPAPLRRRRRGYGS